MRLPLAPVAALLLTACGGPTTAAGTTDVDTAALTSPSGSHKHGRRYFHYAPSIASVEWRPGCGIPTDPPCYVGVMLTFTAPYADVQTVVTSRLDEATHTLTLVVDSFSVSEDHPRTLVSPESRELGQQGFQFGNEYTVNVVDYQRRPLWTGTLTPALAP